MIRPMTLKEQKRSIERDEINERRWLCSRCTKMIPWEQEEHSMDECGTGIFKTPDHWKPIKRPDLR